MRRTSNNAKPVTWTDECSNEQVAADDRLDSTLISWLSNCFFIYTSIFTFCLRVISHFLSHFSLSLFFFLSHTKCTFRETHLSLTTNASLLALLIAQLSLDRQDGRKREWSGRQREKLGWNSSRSYSPIFKGDSSFPKQTNCVTVDILTNDGRVGQLDISWGQSKWGNFCFLSRR